MDTITLVVVPDIDDSDCADVYVDGSIAGRPYRFIVDTGAARSQVVADPFIDTLVRAGSETSAGALGGTRNALVQLPDVTIGPITTGLLLASLVEGGQPGARNLIGMDVLRYLCCEFRFSTQELRVGEARTEKRWRPLHLDAVAHPYVQIEWPSIRGDAVWDSGAGVTVVDERFYRRWPELFTPGGTSLGTDATGAQVVTEMAAVAASTIGGAPFRAHKVAVVDLTDANATLDRQMDFILGYPALSQADWLFDFPASRWCVSHPPALAQLDQA